VEHESPRNAWKQFYAATADQISNIFGSIVNKVKRYSVELLHFACTWHKFWREDCYHSYRSFIVSAS